MAERKIDTTVMLEEMIEHHPELRDVLSRRRGAGRRKMYAFLSRPCNRGPNTSERIVL